MSYTINATHLHLVNINKAVSLLLVDRSWFTNSQKTSNNQQVIDSSDRELGLFLEIHPPNGL